ncbi:hypothetical protein BDB01DRAFT_468586 [Pilobolus umbonatus]|nr:hypothetical protein BDB01DRAFT_468586 [Pilobolus umbonatus]
MSNTCSCTYSMSSIDLFEVCISPAIHHLTSMIYSSTVNPFLFGKYAITDMFIVGQPLKLKCNNTNIQAFNRLKDDVELQQKNYKHLNIHVDNTTIQSVINQGAMSVIQNPLGGLLEQIISGRFMLVFNSEGLFYDRGWYICEKNAANIIYIAEYTRVTETMREDGISRSVYFDNQDVALNIFYHQNGEDYVTTKSVKGITFQKSASFPIDIKSIIGVNIITLTFHEIGESKSFQVSENTDLYEIIERTTLSLFV